MLLSLFLLQLSGTGFGATLVEMNAVTGTASEMQGSSASNAAEYAPGSDPEYKDDSSSAPAPLAAPASGLDAEKKKAAQRGPAALQRGWLGSGGYLSITKLLLFLLVFFCWVFTTNWVSCDSEKLELENRFFWNSLNFFTYLIASSILFYLPVKSPILFFVTFPLTFLCWLVPVIVYVVVRNKPLPPFERVMTGEHLKYLFAVFLSKFGIKMKIKKTMSYEGGSPIEISAAGRNVDPQALGARTILARNNPGFNDFRRIVFDSLERKADGILFDSQSDQTAVKFLIDGVWIDMSPLNRDRGDAAVFAMKLLVGGDPEKPQPRLVGSFLATIRKKTKFNADLTVQTAQGGVEKAIVSFVIQKVPFNSLEELGIRPETQTKIVDALNAPRGLVVFSAAPANGLRSTMNVAARSADRYTRDFATVEDVQNPYQFIENVTLNQYDSLKGENPMSVLPDVFFREPQVLLIRDLVNTDTLKLCCEEVEENNRLIITTLRAKDAVDTILRMLAMKVPPQLLASALRTVISQRLIRKLCPDCKEVFEPQPALLQRLGLPPDRVTQLYRVRSAPQPGEKQKPCLSCNDIGYLGRTALCEVIEINDEIRKILVSNPAADAIRKASVQAGNRGFLFEGALLVAKGITSVEELARVMKS